MLDFDFSVRWYSGRKLFGGRVASAMSDWLDELVSRTKQNYKNQEALRDERLEEQKLKASLGKAFFADLKIQLKSAAEKFNTKFGSDVFSVNDDGPENIINIRSKPDPMHTWIGAVSYIPEAHKINVNRSPGPTNTYSLALTKQWDAIVALYGNNTDVENAGFNVERLSQDIMSSMLLPKP
jgi:hypothetical protein